MVQEPAIVVPQQVYDTVVATQGTYYEGLSHVDRHKLAADLLGETKPHQQASVLQRYHLLKGARLLEVGCGLGTNLIVWSNRYGADVAGVEPDAVGFEASFKLAQTLMRANGLEAERVVHATRRKAAPFLKASFDIVVSAQRARAHRAAAGRLG